MEILRRRNDVEQESIHVENKGSADLLEDRSRRVLALLDEGLWLDEVGRRIGCNASPVMRWRGARQRSGPGALWVRSWPGHPWKLRTAQRQRLVKSLLDGLPAHGYRTNSFDGRAHHPVGLA